MGYLLSIMVPTKNRYKYLYELVNLIVSFETEEIELVIQDNSDNNTEFIDFLNEVRGSNSWIKYYHTNEYLTSIQNFDKAMKNCTGEYVCFIGDDDGVVRNIVDYVKWMKDNNIDALRCPISGYFWPATGKYGSYLKMDSCDGHVEHLNPINELQKVLRNGCQGLGNMPVVYAGIAKRAVLDRIYKDFGTYFLAPSADMASGVALCFYVNKYVKVHSPIIITGTSKMTGGGVQQIRLIKLKDVPFINQTMKDEWEGYFPPLWTGTLVWPESCIKTLRKMGKEAFLTMVNYSRMMACFNYANKSYKEVALELSTSKIQFYYYLIKIYTKWFVDGVSDRLIRLISRKTRCLGGRCYYNVSDIKNAENLLYKYELSVRKI